MVKLLLDTHIAWPSTIEQHGDAAAGEADIQENTTWADAEFVKYAIGSFLSCARTYAIQSEAVLPPTESTNVKPLASCNSSVIADR